ncbi:MAG TPA: TetR/AcrR family transcriptional regulator [Bacillota bacterium]|nr:TetR/AcrR family transcriptional regulator [Bacillota bacterium]
MLETAIHEFAHHGFDNANINTIAEKAGISVGSIYKYFDTKKDLFLTCVHHGVETLEQVLNEVLVSREPLLVKLEKIIRLIQEHSRSQRHLIMLYNEITAESNSELTWELAAEMETISARVYSSLVEQAQKEGIISGEYSPRLFSFFLDNLFMMLQFSYACDYYRERFKIYAGEDILEKDELVVEQLMKFIKASFNP